MPTLHMKTGLGNHLVKATEKHYPEIEQHWEDLGLVRDNYQGKNFEGNQIDAILSEESQQK